jgi:outer membrane protein TolC
MTRATLGLVAALVSAATVAGSEPVRLSLAEAVALARERSPRLGQLRALEEAAAAGERGARAARMPQLDLSAAYTRWSDVPDFTIVTGLGLPRTIFPNLPNSYRARVGVSVPVYAGGRITGLADAAAQQRLAAGRELDSGAADVTLEVTTAYWALVTAIEAERVLSDAIGTYAAHLEEARNRQRFGMAARNEVLQVQVEMDRAELSRLEAENATAIARADLERLLGLPPGTVVEATEPLVAPQTATEDLETLVAAALESRPERAALTARVASSEASARAQQAGWRPNVAFVAGYDYANPNSRWMPPENAWHATWNAGMWLSWSVFDGGRTAAAVGQAKAQADAARAQLEDFDRRVRLDVTSRWLDVRTSDASVQVASRNVDASRENQRVARDRYEQGVLASFEMLDAETQLLRAGLEQTRAQARQRLALARLDRAVGR